MVEIMIIRAEKEIGMGCCGGICEEGIVNMSNEFKHHDDDREQMGQLYQRLDEKYGEQIHITFLDPRNLFALAGYFIKQVKNHHISPLEALKNFSSHIRYNALFINGQYSEKSQNYDTLINDMLQA
ncbi:hypothetical protein [Halobacillus seohaensis]|uniref:Uncharacterized protein n=1 Tax=Halobacillus seohaensis TaxID=447421 RepID=A0ABW2EF79_9BACI